MYMAPADANKNSSSDSFISMGLNGNSQHVNSIIAGVMMMMMMTTTTTTTMMAGRCIICIPEELLKTRTWYRSRIDSIKNFIDINFPYDYFECLSFLCLSEFRKAHQYASDQKAFNYRNTWRWFHCVVFRFFFAFFVEDRWFQYPEETLVPLCHPESRAKTLIENLLCSERVLEAQ